VVVALNHRVATSPPFSMPAVSGSRRAGHVLHVALEHAALDGRAHATDFRRDSRPCALFAHGLRATFDDLRCGSCADEHEFVDL